MLADRYAAESLDLVSQTDWSPYPNAAQREAWTTLPTILGDALIQAGQEALQEQWQPLLASEFLAYDREGSRLRYEEPYFRRRHLLSTLAFAECAEGEGRFLDHLIDGLWLTCEETYWGLPAHLYAQQAGPGLPDVNEPTVDLFAAETAMSLVYIDFLLAEQLESVSPLLRPRITQEIQRRVLTPCFERDDFHWMGFQAKRGKLNNWNPWICSNWLACILFIEADPQRRRQMVHRALRCLDYYLEDLPADGGCDEGPNYWFRAAASVYDCLELLHQASQGQINIFGEPLIQEMARFIYRTHIDGSYYVNFADASAIVQPDAALVYRYGEAIGDAETMAYATWAGQGFLADSATGMAHVRTAFTSPMRGLRSVFAAQTLTAQTAQPPQPRDVWLPDLQVMIARDEAASSQGFFVAAKGGHNNESHNHNDIGEFIVYIDGLPVLVDAGVEDYSRKTFSPQRYEIWTMQSAYHNLPTIDGVQQAPGTNFAADNLNCRADDAGAEFSLDIAGAYPPEAGLNHWRRTIRLQRGQQIEIEDSYALNHVPTTMTLSLITACTVNLDRPGEIDLTPADLIDGRRSGTGMIVYDPAKFTAASEIIHITDKRMSRTWGTQLRRIVLTAQTPQQQDTWLLRIKRRE